MRRAGETYRGPRREVVKAVARANREPWSWAWRASVYNLAKLTEVLRPFLGGPKYMPHQGKRECARRLARLAA